MPQIIVTADRGDGTITWRERINASDFESDHFAQQLVQRIGWAVDDAHEVEQDADRHPLSAEAVKPASVAPKPAPGARKPAPGARKPAPVAAQ